jgi:hypothetical protein
VTAECLVVIRLITEEQISIVCIFESKIIRLFSMRELLTGLLLASCLLPVAAGGLRLSSEIAQPIRPHTFAGLHEEPLWTSGAKRVDPGRQAYQRLPAAMSPNTMLANVKPVERVNVTLGSSRPANASAEQDASPDILLAEMRAEKEHYWCSTRYRSYDPVSNTYQPYRGGPRQTCAAPIETPATPVQEVADVGGANGLDANARWCMEKFSSYRVEDNTYQPFTGGRKQCPGLQSRSASNSIRNSAIAQF